jgi:voltage-gated potassium channel
VRKERREVRARAWYERLTLWRAVATIIVATTVFAVLAAVAMRIVEPEAFPDFGEALWWSITTVSTTGYGDLVPQTGAGRWVAGMTMLAGMAFVPVLTSVIVAVLVQRAQERNRRAAELLPAADGRPAQPDGPSA